MIHAPSFKLKHLKWEPTQLNSKLNIKNREQVFVPKNTITLEYIFIPKIPLHTKINIPISYKNQKIKSKGNEETFSC